MKNLSHIDALPTWVLVRCLLPFMPESHPWKRRKFSLIEWGDGRTGFSRCADFVLWLYFAGIPMVWVLVAIGGSSA